LDDRAKASNAILYQVPEMVPQTQHGFAHRESSLIGIAISMVAMVAVTEV
jgi:hypothetical protein